MCEREMCVTADKTYIKINPLLTLVPHINQLNTMFNWFSFLYCFVNIEFDSTFDTNILFLVTTPNLVL